MLPDLGTVKAELLNGIDQIGRSFCPGGLEPGFSYLVGRVALDIAKGTDGHQELIRQVGLDLDL